MDCIDNFTLFASNWHNMVFIVTQACVQLLFYAIYLNFFVLGIWVLGRRKVAKREVLLVQMWVLTAFGTTQVVLCLVETATLLRIVEESVEQGSSLNVLKLGSSSERLQTAQHFTFAVNTLAAHCLFVYRCYVVWGSQWKVAILPSLLAVGSFVSICAIPAPRLGTSPPQAIQRVPYIVAAATNLILVALTAGRIWWIRSDAVYVCADSTVVNQYNTAIAMILESGVLHGIIATLLAITYPLAHIYPKGLSFWAIQALAMHFINIAPCLVIVRVGFGHDIQEAIERSGGTKPIIHHARTSSRLVKPFQLPDDGPVLDIRPGVEEDQDKESIHSWPSSLTGK
ncbi:hypothetical protein B0H16DRAFT_994150 [Mycena metata]|uniref:Uncharacterized protein n=1 Tax=Mycena metata TaxID=1033252 RepID=A0AAD7IIW5_9AGAR|nr:hypothetical protein B0H16DRAFT_994150 [Mycena metata]